MPANLPPQYYEAERRYRTARGEQEKIAIVSMVEHVMRALVNFAERVMVMHQGKKLVDAPTQKALNALKASKRRAAGRI